MIFSPTTDAVDRAVLLSTEGFFVRGYNGRMNLREILRRCLVACLAIWTWIFLGFLWLIIPLLLVAHAMEVWEELGSRPAWAIGNLWAAFVIGSLLLLWTWKMATWKDC